MVVRLMYATEWEKKQANAGLCKTRLFMQPWWVSGSSVSYLLCLLKKTVWWVQKHIIKLSSFKFGHIEIASEDFYNQRQVTDILAVDVNKALLYDRRPRVNGKDWRYIVSYQVEEETVEPLFIKTPKNIFNYSVSQCDKKSAYKISFNVSEAEEWLLQFRKIQNEVKSQFFENLTKEPMKGGGKYMHGKLKMLKERIKINGQDVSYHIDCIATAVLEVGHVYK